MDKGRLDLHTRPTLVASLRTRPSRPPGTASTAITLRLAITLTMEEAAGEVCLLPSRPSWRSSCSSSTVCLRLRFTTSNKEGHLCTSNISFHRSCSTFNNRNRPADRLSLRLMAFHIPTVMGIRA